MKNSHYLSKSALFSSLVSLICLGIEWSRKKGLLSWFWIQLLVILTSNSFSLNCSNLYLGSISEIAFNNNWIEVSINKLKINNFDFIKEFIIPVLQMKTFLDVQQWLFFLLLLHMPLALIHNTFTLPNLFSSALTIESFSHPI